jgi:hypothetical protein
MKKILLAILTFSISLLYSQTAVNFNVNDCAGTNHDLFNEMNSGKVVVLAWVMPCSSCIGPVLSAQTEIQNHLSANPGKILFYIIDDFGNTTCASLNNWCNTNGITNSNARFSTASINETDYGTTGMPKIVIAAGTNHQVFFNQNNVLTVSNFNAAMSNALVAANAAGIKENPQIISAAKISPNPASFSFSLTYHAAESKDMIIELYNAIGQKSKIVNSKSVTGENTIKIETSDLANGTYIVKINGESSTKLVVSH